MNERTRYQVDKDGNLHILLEKVATDLDSGAEFVIERQDDMLETQTADAVIQEWKDEKAKILTQLSDLDAEFGRRKAIERVGLEKRKDELDGILGQL